MIKRVALLASLAIGIVAAQVTGALAVTTGAINGKVTDSTTHAPVADAIVVAIAGSGSYRSTTDSNGFYGLQGLPPDTYEVTVSRDGYQVATAQGVTVSQGGQAITLDIVISKDVKTIGKVTATGVGSYVQKGQTIDQYNVGVTAQEQLLSIPFASNEAQLLTELPGVSSVGGVGGYPLLRGGLENQAGFQIEGIQVTDPFTNQFSNNLVFNGARSINVVVGPGDATQGGAGTGSVNSIAKIGSYPSFGQYQGELGFGAYAHNFNAEYGSATADGRFSYYLSGRYQRDANGPYTTENVARLNDLVGAQSYTTTDDDLANLIYRFGQGNRNQAQLFYETGLQRFYGDFGINPATVPFYTQDPLYVNNYDAFCGCNIGPNQLPAYPTVNSGVTSAPVPNQTQNYSLLKVGFSRQFTQGTYLNTRVYTTTGITPFYVTQSNLPYLAQGFGGLNFGDFYELEQYRQTGAAFDFQRQAGDRNFITIGGEYRHSVGSLVTSSPSISFLLDGATINDFNPYDATLCPTCLFGAGGPLGGPNGLRIPTFTQTASDPVNFSDVYFTDQMNIGSHLTIQPGLRWESQRVSTPAGLYDAKGLAPKFSAALDIGKGSVLRASYGHADVFAPLGQIEGPYTPDPFYRQFTPAYFAAHGLPNILQPVCGGAPLFNQPCANYYDELSNTWFNNNGVAPYSFPKAQQSDSYDFSIEHDFGNAVSMKLTPYYRRDYDVIVNQGGIPIIINHVSFPGPTVVTNNARGQTFGVELGLQRQVAQGLSSQLNVTYINQFINYLSGGAFLPSVLPSTLATVVHPSYLRPFNMTLAFDYHRNGWHINPVFNYDHGAPFGTPENFYTLINGVYTAVPNTNTFGSTAANCFFTDPQVPGTPQNPNIVGSVGGACSKARNGILSKASVGINLGISRQLNSRATVGLSITNLLDNRANGFTNNPGYVNNGYGAYGPGSGASQFAGLGIPGVPTSFPPGPFFTTASGAGRSGVFYVNFKM